MDATYPADSDEAIDRLLGEVLDAPELRWSMTLDDLCEDYPEHADRLRRRFSYLQRVGFVVPASPDDVRPGGRFGRFELAEMLGSGGMGTVFRARCYGQDETLALKVLRPELVARDQARERLLREGRLAAELEDQRLCPVLEVGEHRGTPYLTMPLIDGESLAACLRSDPDRFSDGAANVRATVTLFASLAQGVGYLHARGLVHRDIKPSNVLLRDGEQPVLVDFGLAWNEEVATLTLTGQPIGTPAYMPPEQVRGRDVSSAADVYSLGASLYECLTGRPPFQAGDRETLYREILREDPPALRSANQFVSGDLERVVLRCLAKDPRHRFASADALAEELDRVAAGRRVVTRRTSGLRRASRWVQRRPLLSVSIVAAAATLAALALALRHVDLQRRALSDSLSASVPSVARHQPLIAASISLRAARTEGFPLSTPLRSQLLGSLDGLRQCGEVSVGQIVSMAVPSPDGESLLVAAFPDGENRSIRVLEAGDYIGPWRQVIVVPANFVVWSEDGAQFAGLLSRSPAGRRKQAVTEIRIGRAEAPQRAEIRSYEIGFHRRGRKDRAFEIATFGPEGHLYFGDNQGFVTRFGAADGPVRVSEPARMGDVVVYLARRAETRQLVVVRRSGLVELLPLDSSERARKLPRSYRLRNWNDDPSKSGPVIYAGLSASGDELVLGSHGGLLEFASIVGPDRPSRVRTVPGIAALAVSPRRSELVVGCGEKLTRAFWARRRGQGINGAVVRRDATVASVAAWSSDGARCVVGFEEAGGIRYLSAGPYCGVRSVLLGHDRQVSHLVFEPGDAYLLSSSWDGTVRRWQLEPPDVPMIAHSRSGVVQVVPVSEELVLFGDGGRFGVATADGQLLDQETRQNDTTGTAPILGLSPPGHSVLEDRAHRLVVFSSVEGAIRFFSLDPTTGLLSDRLGSAWRPPDDSPSALVVLRSGEVLVGTVKGHLWRLPASLDSSRAMRLNVTMTGRVMNLVEAADGRVAGLAQLDQVVILKNDSVHWSMRLPFEGRSLDWQRAGGRLAVGGGNGELALIDPATSALTTLLGHAGTVRDVEFSPDGRYLASASMDGSARVWTVAGELYLDLQRPDEGGVKGVAWTPSGQRLATAHSLHGARTWPMESDADLVRRVERRLFRQPTASERERFGELLGR